MRRMILSVLATALLFGAMLAGLGVYATAGSSASLPTDPPFSVICQGSGGKPAQSYPVPTISGTVGLGQVLHVTNGEWNCNPTEFHYQWQLMDTITWLDGDSPDLIVPTAHGDFSVVVSACNEFGCNYAYDCIADASNPVDSTPAHDQYGNPIFDNRCRS